MAVKLLCLGEKSIADMGSAVAAIDGAGRSEEAGRL
jgi:hypothetical protein